MCKKTIDSINNIFWYNQGATSGLLVFHNTASAETYNFLSWGLGAESNNESIFIDLHVKMSNFTAEINIFTVRLRVLTSIARFGMYDNCMGDEFLYISSGKII